MLGSASERFWRMRSDRGGVATPTTTSPGRDEQKIKFIFQSLLTDGQCPDGGRGVDSGGGRKEAKGGPAWDKGAAAAVGTAEAQDERRT